MDQQKFEPLYRAGKAIEGATSVGVSYLKLGELLQGLATEVLVYKDRTNGEEEELLVALHAKALQIYKDSLVVWKPKIDTGETLAPNVYGGREVSLLVDQYNLDAEANTRTPDLVIIKDGDAALRKMWSVADLQLQRAELVYKGKGQEVRAAIAAEEERKARALEAERASRAAAEARHQEEVRAAQEAEQRAEKQRQEEVARREAAERAEQERITAEHENEAHRRGFASYRDLLAAQAREEEKRAKAATAALEQARRLEAERQHAAAELERQRQEAERTAAQQREAERDARRPKPYKSGYGWTCPPPYMIHNGKCYEPGELPRVEMGKY
jgi:hypothetical protein